MTRPFDPDDEHPEPWADDRDAPREPGEDPGPRGPAALLDPEIRDQIEREILYQQTRKALARWPRDAARMPPAVFLPVFVITLAVVAAAAGSVRQAAFLFLVGLAHEVGHLLAMRALGLRVPYLFLVPFFESVVVRLPDTPTAWKRAVVVLLGPLPGLFVGVALSAAARPEAGSWLAELCLTLVALNGIALLPVLPLDGGRLIDLLEPTHRPLPGAIGRLVVAAALGFTAALSRSWPLAIGLAVLAGLVLLAVPLGYRQARSRQALRRLLPGLPEQVADLSEPQRRRVFDVAVLVYPVPDPLRLARVMRVLQAQAAARTAGPFASAALWGAYLLAAAAAAVFTGLVT
jgi:hypothetical protein